MTARRKRDPHQWGKQTIEPGKSVEVQLAVSESYSGLTLPIPVMVHRGLEDGPSIFITAALHGDEINGTGIIRALIQDPSLQLKRGTLILVPVLNLLGFERHTRYLPDRRDLNRCFPGSKRGSLAHRMAKIIFDEIVARADYGIDLHTAATRRTNFPNVRADMSNAQVAQLAHAFGSEVILDAKGPQNSLRREATKSGCPTIILEAGEIWKVEPSVVEFGLGGVLSVLAAFDMIDGEPYKPAYETVIDKTQWMRASKGGFLRFHISPGDLVPKGAAIATYTTLMGNEFGTVVCPKNSLVLGMTTLPSIRPGDPICHLGFIDDQLEDIASKRTAGGEDHMHQRLMNDLSTSVRTVEHE